MFYTTFRAVMIAALLVPMALYGCADSGAGGGGTSSGGSSSGADGGGSSSGSDSSSSSGGTSSGGTSSGGTSSGGTSSGDAGSSGGAETKTSDLLSEIQGAVDYKKCSQFTNKSKGVTVRNLTVVSPRRYVTSKLDGIYVQAKGGGDHSGLYVVGEAKGDVSKLKIGEVITVTGNNKGFYCAQQLDAELVNKESGTELPAGLTVTLAKVGQAASLEDNQKLENALVEVHNVTVVDTVGDKANFGNVYVGKDDADKALVLTTIRDKGWSDALGVYDWDKKTWTYNVKKGDKLKVVRGIVTFSFDHWRLHPTHVEK